MNERIYNFSAGPAVLPEPVIQRAQKALWNLDGSGIGICEHSHRSPEFDEVISSAREGIRKLAGIGDDYEVLFLQGGASTQFFMAPMSFLDQDHGADYVNTGEWSKKAMKEAGRFGPVHVAGSSEEDGFRSIPRQLSCSASPVYLHYTSNNTIYGTEFHAPPAPPAGAELFCDASSDIFSRPIDASAHGLIYAGAQKNLGPSGVTLVIIKKSLVERGNGDLPTMLQYRTHAAKGSMFNTPPTFGIYMLGEVISWLQEFGGLAAIADYNADKAALLYDFLDDSKLFHAPVAREDRSRMNVVFRSTSGELDAQLVEESKAAGLSGLKGYRTVGGMRASIYNAFPREGVVKLVEFLKAFEAKHG